MMDFPFLLPFCWRIGTLSTLHGLRRSPIQHQQKANQESQNNQRPANQTPYESSDIFTSETYWIFQPRAANSLVMGKTGDETGHVQIEQLLRTCHVTMDHGWCGQAIESHQVIPSHQALQGEKHEKHGRNPSKIHQKSMVKSAWWCTKKIATKPSGETQSVFHEHPTKYRLRHEK